METETNSTLRVETPGGWVDHYSADDLQAIVQQAYDRYGFLASPSLAREACRAPSSSEYITQQELAERVGVTVQTIRRRIADGTIPAVRIGGRGRIRIPASEADRITSPIAADAERGAGR